MAADPKNAGKPQQILEKMVIGKLGKFYENNCLAEQAYVKDDAMSVQKYVDATAKELRQLDNAIQAANWTTELL